MKIETTLNKINKNWDLNEYKLQDTDTWQWY